MSCRRTLAVVLVTAAVCVPFAAPAGAQTPTPTPTATPTASSPGGSTTSGDREALAIGILVLGAFGATFAYFFYDRWRGSYERLASRVLATTRSFPETVFDPVANSQFRSRGLRADEATGQPAVTGPMAVVVGERATYKATVGGTPAAQAAWSVEPADAGKADPATGAETVLTASREGPLTLTAQVGETEPTLVHVTALTARRQGGVPLLGTSWAGVTAVIVAFSIAGALTAFGTLGADAFIAFLGPVVGYFFAAARTGGGAGNGGDDQSGPPSSG